MSFFKNLFGKPNDEQPGKGVLESDSWNFYKYTYGDGQLAIVFFDTQAAEEPEHTGFNYCCRVVFYIDPANCGDNGIMDGDENRKLKPLEDALFKALPNTAKHVGRMTYGCMKDLVFQVNDVEAFREDYKKWAATVTGYKVELKESEGWAFFDSRVKPDEVTKQQIFDREVIQLLLKNGSDPNKEHMLEHNFTGDAARLQVVEQQLTAGGFTLVDKGDDFLLLSKPLVLDEEKISDLTGKLVSFCRANAVVYDGWGAMIVK